MKLNENTRLKWVNYGTANSFDYNNKGHHNKVIEINKELINHPSIFWPVIKHELRHSNKEFSLRDLRIDLTNYDKIPSLKMLSFMIAHPKSLTQFSPLWYRKKEGFVYDINLSIIWIIAIILSIVLTKIF